MKEDDDAQFTSNGKIAKVITGELQRTVQAALACAYIPVGHEHAWLERISDEEMAAAHVHQKRLGRVQSALLLTLVRLCLDHRPQHCMLSLNPLCSQQ